MVTVLEHIDIRQLRKKGPTIIFDEPIIVDIERGKHTILMENSQLRMQVVANTLDAALLKTEDFIRDLIERDPDRLTKHQISWRF